MRCCTYPTGMQCPSTSPDWPKRQQLRRCARRQAGVPVSLLATAALFLVLLGSPALAAAKQCTRYRGAGCHFTVRHEEPVIYPACLSECKFEVSRFSYLTCELCVGAGFDLSPNVMKVPSLLHLPLHRTTHTESHLSGNRVLHDSC